MAQAASDDVASVVDEKKAEDLSNMFNVEEEDRKLAEVIKVAFLKVDEKTGVQENNPDLRWQVFNTKDERIKVVYREEDGVVQVRSSTKLDISVDDMHEFVSNLHDDEHAIYDTHEFLTSWKSVKKFDADHQIIHSSFSMGVPAWMIWHRDFCYMNRRARINNFIVKEGDKEVSYDIAVSYRYGLDEKHPYYVQVPEKHVRTTVHAIAFIFFNKSDANDEEKKSCGLIYMSKMDMNGSIPKRVTNYVAPIQGMVVEFQLDNMDKIKEVVRKRRQAVVNEKKQE